MAGLLRALPRGSRTCSRTAAARHRRLGVPGRRDPPPAGPAGRRHRATAPPATCRLDVRDAAAVAALIAARAARRASSTPRTPATGAEAWATNVDGARERRGRRGRGRGAGWSTSRPTSSSAGDAGRPYVEDDPPTPVTDYGRSKAAAEAAVLGAHPGAAVVRTSLIYGGEALSAHERAVMDAVDGTRRHGVLHRRAPLPRRRWATWRRRSSSCATLELSGPLHMAGADAVSPLRVRPARRRRRRAATRRSCAATPSAASGSARPLDCRLDCGLARSVLATDVRGVRDVLQGPSRSTAQAAVRARVAEAVVHPVLVVLPELVRVRVEPVSAPGRRGGGRRRRGTARAGARRPPRARARDSTGRLCGETAALRRLPGGRVSK